MEDTRIHMSPLFPSKRHIKQKQAQVANLSSSALPREENLTASSSNITDTTASLRDKMKQLSLDESLPSGGSSRRSSSSSSLEGEEPQRSENENPVFRGCTGGGGGEIDRLEMESVPLPPSSLEGEEPQRSENENLLFRGCTGGGGGGGGEIDRLEMESVPLPPSQPSTSYCEDDDDEADVGDGTGGGGAAAAAMDRDAPPTPNLEEEEEEEDGAAAAAAAAAAVAAEGENEEDRKRKDRVKAILQNSDWSAGEGWTGPTGRSHRDSLVVALEMKPARSVSFSTGNDGEKGLSASLLMSPRPSFQEQRPRRSILKTANSEPLLPSQLKGSKMKRSSTTSSTSNIANIDAIQLRNELRREVSFQSITIREYPMTVGDHPNCSYGPPVTLDWDYDEYEAMDLEKYERRRPPRRNLRQMMMNYYHRKKVLLHWGGHSEGDLKEATARVNRVKRQRKVTSVFMPALRVQEVTGRAVRKVKKAVVKKKTVRTETYHDGVGSKQGLVDI